MTKFKEFFLRIGRFFRRHIWSTLLVLAAILVGGFFIWDSFTAGTFSPNNILNLKPKKETRVKAPLSGILVDAERATRRPIAVVIENHPDARPQSGLNKADFVYETFAEGGITRFLAIFQSQDASEIGPVRSARTYFVDWASSLKALFAHVGGNIDALDMIPNSHLYDLNQFYFGSYFWRDSSRFAPHNVYTTTAKLLDAAKSKNYPQTDDNIPAYVFKDEKKVEERPAVFSFTVNFNYNFAVTYTYNPTENNFRRKILGVVQKDRSGEAIKAKNVLVCFSEFSNGTTRYGEQAVRIRTTGSGNAIFYIDGTKSTGTWKRNNDAVVRFYDQSGKEVQLNAGTTWVDFVPTGTSVN